MDIPKLTDEVTFLSERMDGFTITPPYDRNRHEPRCAAAAGSVEQGQNQGEYRGPWSSADEQRTCKKFVWLNAKLGNVGCTKTSRGLATLINYLCSLDAVGGDETEFVGGIINLGGKDKDEFASHELPWNSASAYPAPAARQPVPTFFTEAGIFDADITSSIIHGHDAQQRRLASPPPFLVLDNENASHNGSEGMETD